MPLERDDLGNVTAYPLVWPEGWARTPASKTAWPQFGQHSVRDCTDKILNEVRLAGGSHTVISTNVPLKLNGLPYSNQRPPADSGAAVYFQYKGKPIVLACDKWRTVEHNLWAITCHLSALRGQDRWGVGNLEQAFQGYLALPAPESPWQVLGIAPTADEDEIRSAYRELVRKTHPDAGGNQDDFERIGRTVFVH